MVYPNGWNVRHAKGYGRSDSGVTGHDAVRPVDQNRIDEAKLLDAGCNLFICRGVCVRGLVGRALSLRGSSYLMVSAFTMPPKPWSSERPPGPRIRLNFPNSDTNIPISRSGFPNYFRPQNQPRSAHVSGAAGPSHACTQAATPLFPIIFPNSGAC
jgi:hypothetical protein